MRIFRTLNRKVEMPVVVVESTTSMSRTTGIYARVATSAHKGVEPTQRERAITYATDGLGIAPRDLRVFCDTAPEARTDSSSEYQRLLAVVTNREIERVIVTDAARLGKNIRDLHAIITRFIKNDVAVHIIDAGLRIGETEYETACRTPLETLETARELEVSMNTDRTKEGIAVAQENGKHVGRPPFGFDSDGNGGLVPNEDFETALRVIERIEAGASKRSTAREADISRSTIGNIVERKQLYLDAADRPTNQQ